ncbi:hypothetical protein [Natrialba taiwanensis]|uniref:RCK C-terminal domain-containing protein n=1 Tax=Natrialba taiwanensis DSM 12281 TaxID=1230458 RepID=M0AD59_9EURY|nr:hypothetical protein [Natrialba taiwanensis]ELY96464.1 hypothetical protein C484_02090 [Natrialba taiwanensis DSM 12281]
MVDLPYESLLGVSYGLLAGTASAVLFGLIAAGVGLARDRSVPAATGLLAAPIAAAIVVFGGVHGSGPVLAQAIRLAFVGVIAGVLGVFATSQGAQIATALPQDRTFPIVRGQALSADAIDAVDAMGQVTIRPTGAIREFDGYPPLSPALRTALENGAWRFPADLQLAELEDRLERRLRTDHGLATVRVAIDGRGRATIAAAPPSKGVATTLDDGFRAVTVTGLLPTGLEPGDRVLISGDETTVEGTALAIDDETQDATDHEFVAPAADTQRAAIGTDGGDRRLTVAVETAAADALLESTRHRIAVQPSDDATHNHALEAATILDDAGQPITVRETALAELDPATTIGVRTAGDWHWQHSADDPVPQGADRAFVAGSPRSDCEERPSRSQSNSQPQRQSTSQSQPQPQPKVTR